jgi:chromosome segregation ATPase
MSEQIDRSLAELTEAGQVQSGELHQKILELAQLTEVVNLTRAEVDAKTLEVSRMKGQLEEVESERARLESIFEQLTMDFDEATNNLQALKSVCGADLDTVAFMQEDPILKGNSVKKTLEYVQVELESAEKRLALLIRAKEQAGFAIQKTILNGDGAISLKEERGDNHVNRNEPESKDPGVGDTAGDD